MAATNSDNNNEKDKKGENESRFFSFVKQRIEHVLGVNSGSDLRGDSGVNEVAFKMLVLGCMTGLLVPFKIIMKSELPVKKTSGGSGYADIYLETIFGKILIELKYVSLAFANGIKPLSLHYDQHVTFADELQTRKTNFLALSDESKKSTQFVVNDTGRKIRDKLVKLGHPFTIMTSKPDLIKIPITTLTEYAKSQVSDYYIEGEDDIIRYVMIGVGPSVFVEKL